MKAVLALLSLVVLVSCTTTKTHDTARTKPNPGDHSRFETAIASAILTEVSTTLPYLPAPQRLAFLKQQTDRFNQGVDSRRISQSLRLEGELLDYLLRLEESNIPGVSYGARAQQLSSLTWPEQWFTTRVTEELERIDAMILAQSTEPTLQDHLAAFRSTITYPENSVDGRQGYLDDLSQAMMILQTEWRPHLEQRAPSTLQIVGHEDSTAPAFVYERSARDGALSLKVNLTRVNDLPNFEMTCLAAYYGYPGLQAFSSVSKNSIKHLLDLPGYREGWANTFVDIISEAEDTQSCQWFSRLQGSAAWADLQMGKNRWDQKTALDYLAENTPYSRTRLRGIVTQIREEPGFYLAAFVGRIKFREILRACESTTSSICKISMFQQFIDLGPIPFEHLERQLNLVTVEDN